MRRTGVVGRKSHSRSESSLLHRLLSLLNSRVKVRPHLHHAIANPTPKCISSSIPSHHDPTPKVFCAAIGDSPLSSPSSPPPQQRTTPSRRAEPPR
jgi:hypothetical protein